MSKLDVYAKGSHDRLQPNFKISEFACKCQFRNCQITLHDPELSKKLQALRMRCGKAITVNSGYRCAEHNKAVGGSATSYHTKGMAADIKVKGLKPEALAQLAEEVGFTGIGVYDSFIHVDTRPDPYFWYQATEKKVSTFRK